MYMEKEQEREIYQESVQTSEWMEWEEVNGWAGQNDTHSAHGALVQT